MPSYQIRSVLVIEPNEILACGLVQLLRQNTSLQVTRASHKGEKLLEQIRNLAPDLLVASPLLLGNPLLSQVADMPGVRTIAVVASCAHAEYIRGYDETFSVNKPFRELLEAIKRVENPLFPGAASAKEDPADEADHQLSPREQEVVAGVARGLSNKEIGARMQISVHTVITHRRNIAKKLQIHSASGLTIYALANNLVSWEEVHAAD